MISELLQQGGLSFDRLQSFCLVAEAGGVTKAAKGDATKQSLYSRQIRELEEFFGLELIRRKGRGIVLTDAGDNLHRIVREQFTALSDFKNECRNHPAEVVIGTGDSIIQWLLLPQLAQLRLQLPLIRLKFLNLATDDAVKRLSDGAVDFAIVRQDAVSRPMQTRPLGVMSYALFCPGALIPAATARPDLRILHQLPLATLEGEGNFRGVLAEVARKKRLALNIQVECSSFPLAARAVSKGGVAAILPRLASADFAGGTVSEIALDFLRPFDRKMCLAANPRSLRIRPILEKVATALNQLCRF